MVPESYTDPEFMPLLLTNCMCTSFLNCRSSLVKIELLIVLRNVLSFKCDNDYENT